MSTSPAQAFSLEAHAKVNLSLAIQYPPQGGYHLARTVMQELSLHDDVHVSIEEGGAAGKLRTSMGTAVDLQCAVEGLNPADNLIFRAIDAAELVCGVAVAPSDASLKITVDKHIPAGGGLGGGSSDAAAALKAYAQLANLDPHDERLIQVAQSLGADVTFFMYGGTALMGGRGDVFEQELPALKAPIILMGDQEGLSTAAVYRAFDNDPTVAPDADALAQALQRNANDFDLVASLCANNLGSAACSLSPRIMQRISSCLEEPGVLNALVSGSGSTSFAICKDDASAQNLAENIAPLCSWVQIC